MIKIDKSLQFENINQENIKKEIEYLDAFVDYQKNIKDYISDKFDTLSLDFNFDGEQADEITILFQRVFEARLNLDCNIINLQKLLSSLKKIRNKKGFFLITEISIYNDLYEKDFPDIQERTTSAKQLSYDLTEFLENKSHKLTDIIPKISIETIKTYEDNNTLKISEKTGNVYLPYYIDDLQKILNESHNKYSSLEDLISKEYIIPLSYYKNSSYARFKEAYKLIRKKEKGSIVDALNLAFELLFNYNLDPAIISACKNLDELDIYLDCLDDNDIDDFYCFNIVYEVMPTIIKDKEKIA